MRSPNTDGADTHAVIVSCELGVLRVARSRQSSHIADSATIALDGNLGTGNIDALL